MKITAGWLRWHRLVYKLLDIVTKPIFCRRFGYSFTHPESLPPPPYIVVSNHNTDSDPFLLGYSFPHLYFVASEHIFKNRLLTCLIRFLAAPIARKKGTVDGATVLDLRRRLRVGAAVCIFPEGSRSMNGRTGEIHPTTGQLIASAKVPLITYKIENGYLSSPRWAFTARRGRMRGRVVGVYPAQELAAMTKQEITDIIRRDINVDAYEEQEREMLSFTGRRLAEGLETALYYCPACSRTVSLETKDDTLSCDCGYSVIYDEYGYFKGNDVRYRSFTEWCDSQTEHVPTGGVDFTRLKNYAKLFEIDSGHKRKPVADGRLCFDAEKLFFEGSAAPVFDIKSICDLTIYGRNCMVFTYHGKYYEIIPEKRFNARLYLDYIRVKQSGSQT